MYDQEATFYLKGDYVVKETRDPNDPEKKVFSVKKIVDIDDWVELNVWRVKVEVEDKDKAFELLEQSKQ